MFPKRVSSTGQALVEFSLILGVLLLFIFMIVEGGRLFQGWVTVQNAARSGGRYAITGHYDPTCLTLDPACTDPRVYSIREEAKFASTGLVIDPNAGFDEPKFHQVEVFGVDDTNTWQPDYAGDSGKAVLVRVMYRMPIITPLLRPIAESVRLTGQVVMNNEYFDQSNNTQVDNTPPDLPPPPTPGPPVADLQIEKSAAPTIVLTGEPVVFTLHVTNNGPSEAQGVVVEDILPPGFTYVGTTPPDICTESAGTVTCALPNLPRGGVFDITMDVISPDFAPPPPGELTNQAIVSGSVVDDISENDSDTATVTVVQSANFADIELVSKTDLPDPVVVGQPLAYTITIGNNGIADATGVQLTDPLPTGVNFVRAVPSQGSCSQSSGTVTCNLGTVTMGSTADVVINVTAPAGDGTIDNTASVVAAEPDPNVNNNSVTESTTVSPLWTDLFITKVDATDPAPVGEQLLYTLQVGNNGPANATGVSVSDVLPANVTYVSATPSQGSCGQSGGSVSCTLGSIPALGSATVNLIVIPTQTGTVTNQASVSGDQNDPSTPNDSSTAVTTITPKADLSITKTASPASPPGIPAGEVLEYTVVATNNGPSPATGVRVVDNLPIDVSFSSIVASQGNCNVSGRQITCNLGNLASGASATITIEVVPTQGGVITNQATVTANEFDPNGVDNAASDTTTVTGALNSFITLDPICGDPGASVLVTGYNWSANGNHDVKIYWDSESPATLLGTVSNNGTIWAITVDIPTSATADVHTIIARRQNKTATATFTVPCPAPDLTISDVALISPTPVNIGDPVSFEVEISNIGDLDAVSQFFVGLYFDPLPAPIATSTHISQTFRVEIEAITGLAVGDSRTLTLISEEGFSTEGQHSVYVAVDSDPPAIGVIDETSEINNISPELVVTVLDGGAPPPPPPPPSPTPETPGSLVGQAFITAAGGQVIPQANVEVNVYDTGTATLVDTTFTDANGSYYFATLEPATYTVTGCIIIDNVDYFYSVTGIVVDAGLVTMEDLFLEEGPCS